MLPILPEISPRPAPVVPDAVRPNSSKGDEFTAFFEILGGVEEVSLPADLSSPPDAVEQAPFEIATPGSAPFHFPQPSQMPVSGKILPPIGSALPVNDHAVPVLSGSAATMQSSGIALSASLPRGEGELAEHAAHSDAQIKLAKEETPEEISGEDMALPALHLEQGRPIPNAPTPAQPAQLVPAVAASPPIMLRTRVASPFPTVPDLARAEPPPPVQSVDDRSPQTLAAHVLAGTLLPLAEADEATDALSKAVAAPAAMPSSHVSGVPVAAAADSLAPIPVNPSAPAPTSAPATPVAEPRSIAALETAIENLAEAREAGRSARSQVTLSHQEFGAITMRLEASGSDLRATLASRDPGFVPAIQAALAERAVTASSEAASTQSQRGSDQQPGQQGQAHQGGTANGGMSDPRYGSSPGSGNASNLPYRDQTGANEDEQGSPGQSLAAGDPPEEWQHQGIFA